MRNLRLPRLLAAALSLAPLVLSAALSFGQAPPPVPALPDSERRTQYSISASTCACSVGFALFGSGSDVDQWLEVWVAGTRYLSTDPSHGWALTSATGTLATIPRPITDAVLTFTAVQTGVVQIVGAERPRRSVQVQENQGVPARAFNQAITDLVAQNRETWDKINDVTGRTMLGLPGEIIGQMPAALARQGGFLCFDATGLIPQICQVATTGTATFPGSSVSGDVAIFSGTTGKVLADGGPIRTKLTAARTYFVDNVNGSDSNAGLTPGVGGAFLTFAKANNTITRTIDPAAQTITIQLAAGQTWSNISFTGLGVGPGNVIIDGGAGTATTSTGSPAIGINADRSLGNVTIQNFTVTCSGGGNGIAGTGGFTVLGVGITFGACPAGIQRVVANGAEMTALSNYTISGGAAVHIYADAVSLQDDFIPITVTVSGTPAFSQAFAVAVLNGTTYSAGTTYSGSATGARYSAATNGFIGTNNGGANYFPGNTAGSFLNGGRYDSPGTPVAAFTGGTAAPTVTGTDMVGRLTEGTASTGGTITFTTGNAPNACSVGTSSATVQAGLVHTLTSTVLTISHPSASGAVIDWTCPPN